MGRLFSGSPVAVVFALDPTNTARSPVNALTGHDEGGGARRMSAPFKKSPRRDDQNDKRERRDQVDVSRIVMADFPAHGGLPAKASNQCGCEARVPVTAAMRSRRVDAAPASEPPRQIPARARRFCQRHVVDPRRAPGLAAQQPRQRHPSAAPQPEALDRLVAIDRTGRQMAAVVTDQRRQRVPVNPDQRPPRIARQTLQRAGAVGTMREVNASWAAVPDHCALSCPVPWHGTGTGHAIVSHPPKYQCVPVSGGAANVI